MGSGRPHHIALGASAAGTTEEVDNACVDSWGLSITNKIAPTPSKACRPMCPAKFPLSGPPSQHLCSTEEFAEFAEVDVAWEAVGMRGYEILEPLNKGSSSTVALARTNRGDRLFAVKFISRLQAVADTRLVREVVLQRRLGQVHPCVTALRDVRLTESHVCLVVDYANGGELFESLRQRLLRGEGPFPEVTARYLLIQIVAGVSFCHALGVCHRDLKLENLLLHHPDGLPPLPGHILPNTRVKLCDFGAAKSNTESNPKSFVGTMGYIAPEVLRALQMSTVECDRVTYDGRVADTFGLGVALYILLVGAYPFETGKATGSTSTQSGNNEAWSIATVQRIMKGDFTPVPSRLGVSEECMNVLRGLMEPEPTKRLTIGELKDSAWFRAGVLAHPEAHGPALVVSDYICPLTVTSSVDPETPSVEDLERRLTRAAPIHDNFVTLQDIPDIA